jgi:hypothetical protein
MTSKEQGRNLPSGNRTNGFHIADNETSPRSLLNSLLLDTGTAPAKTHDDQPIPDIVIRRLPIYVRTLRALTDSDVRSVSSEELAELIGVTAAQIRRDLSYFGKFGKQGKGYDTQFLAQTISRILRLDRQWPWPWWVWEISAAPLPTTADSPRRRSRLSPCSTVAPECRNSVNGMEFSMTIT